MKLSRLSTPRRASIAAVLMFGLFLTLDGTAMAIFSKMVLFSHVEGVVTRNGEPVEGAEIVQETMYKEPGDVPTNTVTTGPDGRFEFEEITRGRSMGQWLPGEMRILQTLTIRVGDEEYEGWSHNKKSGDENGELDGKPIKLVCELTTTPGFEGSHFGICRVAE